MSRKTKRPTVDPKCLQLAEHFLSDVAGWRYEDLWTLAEAIQETCENVVREVEEHQP